MKKLLLSILCVLGVASMASAETYTCVMSDAVQAEDGSTTWVCQGVTFAADKAESTTAPTINAKNGDMRIYAKGTLTITVPDANITGLSFEISAQGLKRFADITPDVGAIVEQGANPLLWKGANASVTLTVGAEAKYGSEGSSKAGQFDFTSVTVYTSDDTPDTPDTPTVATDGVYTATTTIATGNYLIYAADKIATPLDESKNYGYIQVTDASVVDGTITSAKANQFTITAVDKGYTIQGPDARYYYMTGSYNSFNLSAERVDGDVWSITPNDDGTVSITNVLKEKTLQYDSNYSSYGAYSDSRGTLPTLYVFTKDAEASDVPDVPEEPEVPVIENINALFDLPDKTAFEMGAGLTTVYVNGSYVYVYDGTTYGLIYKYGLGLNAGDYIAAGWQGKVSIYNSLIEMVPSTDLTVNGTANIPAPVEIDDPDMASINLMPYNQNLYIKLIGVNFTEATPDATNATFTGTIGEGDNAYSITFRNPFKLAAVEPGTYDIVAFVGIYNTTVQVNPTEFVPTLSAISSIASDNAPVKFYNIYGAEVANPLPGNIYIKVQGDKAVKVIK